MRKNKFLAALAIAACLATSVPFSVNAATPGQATDGSKVKYGTVSTANQAILKQLFDATYYKKNNPDLAAAGITTDDALFNHFVKCGVFEGRACREGFNVSVYKSAYSDLQAAFGDDIVAYYVHWVNFGQKEKRALVTVEAAAKAGIKVVSAADGAVVSTPAAAAAASTGSGAAAGSAASTDNKAADAASESNTASKVIESSTKVANTIGIERVTSVAAGVREAEFKANIEYDYATGKFYKLNAPLTYETSQLRRDLQFAEIGGKYYHLETLADSIDYATYNVNSDGKYYVATAVTSGKRNDALNFGIDPALYVAEGDYYYAIAQNYNEYYTSRRVNDLDVSGNVQYNADGSIKTKVVLDWNVKKDANGNPIWEAYDNVNDPYNVKFRKVKGSESSGINATKTDYLRQKDNTYYTTFHYSNAAYDSNNVDDDDHKFYTKESGLAKGPAYLASVNGKQYFSVKAQDGYTLKKNATNVTAHKMTDNIATACDVIKSSWIEKGGKWVSNRGWYVKPEDVESYCYCKSGYVFSDTASTLHNATASVYKEVSRDEALLDGYHYWGFDYTYDEIDGDQYNYGKHTWTHYCYDENAEVDKDTAFQGTYPAVPQYSVWCGPDKTYYQQEANPSSIFMAVGSKEKIVQLESNNRFYVVK